MDEYQTKIRTGVLSKAGVAEPSSNDETDKLDGVVAKIAGELLVKEDLITFYFAYDASIDSWEEVQEQLNSRLKTDFSLEKIKQLADGAAAKIISASNMAEELRYWPSVGKPTQQALNDMLSTKAREATEAGYHEESKAYLRALSIQERAARALCGIEHPDLAVSRVRAEVEMGKIISFELAAVNGATNTLYGLPETSSKLIGADVPTLFARLRQWMNEDDYQEFEKDQYRGQDDFPGPEYAIARVPLRFNATHPNPEFRGKKLRLLMTDRHQPRWRKDVKIYYCIVAYLDEERFPT